ncbi:MAG: CCA tRNA nucleotidyltransferase [Lachnospiraceae bacterium]|nr:CCA tRNA nucleotidyltransferase [Lachnospiraceae bacterium]
MQIVLPDKVRHIIGQLREAGYEAYAVGGCVRDSLLGKEPNDWDITTSAPPEQVKSIFRRTVDTGIKHGTVTVLLGKEGFEVTTYRIDGKYEDGRHPKEVTFTKNLEEDLKRRDFTINAMAYNDEAGVIDLFDGLDDIRKGIIRAVGDPYDRFNEDALRILRAVRFAAQLDYDIDRYTLKAAGELAENLNKISAERIRVELEKLLISKHPEKLITLYETGISRVVLPEFDRMMETGQNTPHHIYSVGIHTVEALKNSVCYDDSLTDNDIKLLRLTMLTHDMGKPDARTTDEEGRDHFKGHAYISEKIAADVLHRLKYDNDTLYKVKRLVRYHDHRGRLIYARVRRTIVEISKELIPLWLKVRRCDTCAQSMMDREEKLKDIDDFEKMYKEVTERGDCLSLKELSVTGGDLMELGIKPGPFLGEILNKLFEDVLDVPEHNTKEWLINRASVYFKQLTGAEQDA